MSLFASFLSLRHTFTTLQNQNPWLLSWLSQDSGYTLAISVKEITPMLNPVGLTRSLMPGTKSWIPELVSMPPNLFFFLPVLHLKKGRRWLPLAMWVFRLCPCPCKNLIKKPQEHLKQSLQRQLEPETPAFPCVKDTKVPICAQVKISLVWTTDPRPCIGCRQHPHTSGTKQFQEVLFGE